MQAGRGTVSPGIACGRDCPPGKRPAPKTIFRVTGGSDRHPAPVTPAAFIDRHPGELLGRLQQLVGVSTVNPPGENYDTITKWLVHELEDVGLRTRRYPIPTALMRKELPPEQHGFSDIQISGTPTKIQLTIEHAETVLHSSEFAPTYVTTRPNGPECEPECRSASTELALP